MKLRDSVGRWLEKYDWILYLILFLAALLLRFPALNSPPLNEQEARETWGALHLLRGEPAAGSSPLFTSLTAGLLFLAGASHWAPRIFPALAGSLLVFLPVLFRSSRSKLESILVAVLIALSSSLWIVSTLAGGAMLGLLAAAASIFYLRTAPPRPLLGGILLGAALASGSVGWSGLAIAGIVLSVEWIRRRMQKGAATDAAADPWKDSLGLIFRTPIGLAGLILGLAAGSTGLFFFPRGLAVLATGWTDWFGAFFSGWPKLGEFILLLIAYEPLALVFGIAGLVLLHRASLSIEDRFLEIFTGVAVVWVLIRPASFPADALWVILPLLFLAARALRVAVESTALMERPRSVAIQVGLIFLLMMFSVLNLSAYHSTGKWIYLFLAPAGFLASFLVGPFFSEDWRQGWRRSFVGLAGAWFLVCFLVQAGAGWNATHERRESANEIWWSDTVPIDILRLHGTLDRISQWQTGEAGELPAVIQWPEDSALGWELLTYRAAEYLTSPDLLAAPAMLVSPRVLTGTGVVTLQLTAAYRGQGFAVTEERDWFGLPPDLIGWWLYRRGPVQRGQMILWVRADILTPDEGTGP